MQTAVLHLYRGKFGLVFSSWSEISDQEANSFIFHVISLCALNEEINKVRKYICMLITVLEIYRFH